MLVATFQEGSTKTYTKSIYQFDKGQRIRFEGIEYSEGAEVHFSNQESGGISYAVKIQNGSVKIPPIFMSTGEYIYAWLYAKKASAGSKGGINYHFEEIDEDEAQLVVDSVTASTKPYDYSATLYEVIVPVIQRPNIFSVDDQSSQDDGNPDEPSDMQYEIDPDDENMDIISTGNTGDGTPSLQNYRVEGENFIFTRP